MTTVSLFRAVLVIVGDDCGVSFGSDMEHYWGVNYDSHLQCGVLDVIWLASLLIFLACLLASLSQVLSFKACTDFDVREISGLCSQERSLAKLTIVLWMLVCVQERGGGPLHRLFWESLMGLWCSVIPSLLSQNWQVEQTHPQLLPTQRVKLRINTLIRIRGWL